MKLKIDELSDQQVLKIVEKDSEGGTRRIVKAPLPDGFGMSVGSSFTDPSSTDLADAVGGSAGRVVQAMASATRFATRASGFSTKITQRSNTWYAGPEPTEISFDMVFNSYYSAYDEVVVPVVKLMLMSVGREYKVEHLRGSVEDELERQRSEDETLGRVNDSTIGDTIGKFGFIRSAGECRIHFGKTFVIPRAYVSSVGTRFSNVLDNMGHPTSAECSVTIKVIRNPTQNEIAGQYFNNTSLHVNDPRGD